MAVEGAYGTAAVPLVLQGAARQAARPQLEEPARPPRADRVEGAITGGTGSGTEAREAATERAVLRMVALGVPAAQGGAVRVRPQLPAQRVRGVARRGL
ncbi:MAG TPA: hypothetical protein VLW50_28150 [Streptosporangiaceae bacterium]|nr:hypothetical protein [Streptosporangiaceae bacterium]